MNLKKQLLKGLSPNKGLAGRLALLAVMAVILSLLLAAPASAGSLLTAPTGGETLNIGSTYNITWHYEGSIGLTNGVDLDLSTDSGVTWTPIAHEISTAVGSTPSPESYAWTVPDLNTSKARIRITVWYTSIGGSGMNLQTYVYTGGTDESDDFQIGHVIKVPVLLKAPADLTATATSSSNINLTWTHTSSNETGYSIERKSGSGDFAVVTQTAANVNSYSDSGLTASTTYTYRVKAIGNGDNIHNSGYSNEASAKTSSSLIFKPKFPLDPHTPLFPNENNATTEEDTQNPQYPAQTVMRYYIGALDYFVNDQVQSMDTAPTIRDGRTLLPIRYVATPLGAVVDWNAAQQKVTIAMNGKTIELWIDVSTAKVNGVNTPIDANNPNVTPIIVPPGRTMLPLRFIAENLGCQVDWNQALQEVKVTYPKTSTGQGGM